MSLYEKISNERKMARINSGQRLYSDSKYGLRATVLTTLFGEIELMSKRGTDKTLDEIATACVLKFYENSKANADVYTRAAMPLAYEQTMEELSILEEFLPEKASDEDVEAVITAWIGEHPTAKMGDIMGMLKKTFAPGTYDAKKASEIARKVCA